MFPITMICYKCKQEITVPSYSKYVTCPCCGKSLPFEGNPYSKEEGKELKEHIRQILADISSHLWWFEFVRLKTIYADTAYIIAPFFYTSHLKYRYYYFFSDEISKDLGMEIALEILSEKEKQ